MNCSICHKRTRRVHHLQCTCRAPECKRTHLLRRQREFARRYYGYSGRCVNGYVVKPRAPKPQWPSVDQILLQTLTMEETQ